MPPIADTGGLEIRAIAVGDDPADHRVIHQDRERDRSGVGAGEGPTGDQGMRGQFDLASPSPWRGGVASQMRRTRGQYAVQPTEHRSFLDTRGAEFGEAATRLVGIESAILVGIVEQRPAVVVDEAFLRRVLREDHDMAVEFQVEIIDPLHPLHFQDRDTVHQVKRREPVLYLPTDRFMTAWRHHMRKMLEATRIVEPSVARVLDRLDEVDVFAAFCRNQGEYALGEIRESHPDLAFTRIFLHRFAGHQIFWQLLAVQGAGEAPLQGALPVSVDDIAKLHGVSRVHVRHLLDDGVKEGLLRYGDNNDIVLEGTGRAMARYNQAQQFFVLIAAADKTVREFA